MFLVTSKHQARTLRSPFLAVLVAAVSAGVAVAQTCQCPKSTTLPTTAGECSEFSMGVYRIVVAPNFRHLVAHFPLTHATSATYNPATGILTSPLMIDGATVPGGGTVIAHSARHADGTALLDGCPGATVGTGANCPINLGAYVPASVSDDHFVLMPTGFKAPGLLECHTEIVRMHLQDRGGFGAYVKAGRLPSVTFVRQPPRSYGEAQAFDAFGNVSPSSPGMSFFDVFFEGGAPQLRNGLANPAETGVLYNTTPLLVKSQLDAFPPNVVYLHENSSAVPVYFFGNSVNSYWSNGDVFGFLVLSGHGVRDGANPAAIQAALASKPDKPAGEGGGAGPSGKPGLNLISGPTASTAFAPANLQSTRVDQVSMWPHPNGKAGEFLGAASVTGLSAGLGGMGGYDVVAFTYNRFTNTVTPNDTARVFNSALDEFALNFSEDGTYAVCDRFSSPAVVLQAEKVACAVLGNLRTVAGITGGIDPCPGEVGGHRVLFYNDSTNSGISYRRHDVANAVLLASPAAVTVMLPTGGGRICHSSWPIRGGDGEIAAMLACEMGHPGPSTSRWHWLGDLKSSTPPVLHGGATNLFENNGCLAGGRVYMATTGTPGVFEFDVLGMTADRVPTATGGKIDLMAMSLIKPSNATPDFTIVFAAALYQDPPFSFNWGWGIQQWGLNPAPILLNLGLITHDNLSGEGRMTIRVPPTLGPLVLPVQGLTLQGTQFRTTPAVSVEIF